MCELSASRGDAWRGLPDVAEADAACPADVALPA